MEIRIVQVPEFPLDNIQGRHEVWNRRKAFIEVKVVKDGHLEFSRLVVR